MNKATLGRLAAEVRSDFELTDSQPFDPFRWSEEHGIPFISLREFTADDASMRHFLEVRTEVWSAALVRDGRSHLIIYNPDRTAERTRSDLTHEIAHFEAEHEPSPAWTDSSGRCGGTSKEQEKEAAELAGSILVPPTSARAAALKSVSALEVALRYQVSTDMAAWRMRMSGGYEIRRNAMLRRSR